MSTQTPAEIARAMAVYIREHGFSPQWDRRNGCGCYAHAWMRAGDLSINYAGCAASWGAEPMSTILNVIGARNFWAYSLVDAGWTEGCTDDAAAACDIAADLLS